MTAPNLIDSIRAAGSIDAFRAAAPLPKNTQEMIDNAIVRVGRQRLVLVNDLISDPSLAVPVPNWLSIPTLTSHRLGEAGRASRSMVPGVRGERQLMQWEPYSIPLYVTWDDFQIDAREQAASERVGQPIDTVHAEQATRNVNEDLEDAALNGGVTVGGLTVPGALDTTTTQAYVSNEAWDAAGHDGGDIETDVLAMVAQLQANKFYGPYNLYVNTAYGVKLEKKWSDGVTTFPITIRQHLEQMQFGGRGLRVRVADQLAADRTLLVQMTSDVIDIQVGQQPTPISWQGADPWHTNNVILACIVTRVKVNTEGNYGICAGNKT